MKFQQLTGPVMAKGLEDTSFYIFNRLTSLNEVGGEPGTFGVSVQKFHDFNQGRAKHWPHALSATATHDTKRGEDVRARINVLSEIPDEWSKEVSRWSSINSDKKQMVEGKPAPDANDEYLIYQTLVGAWPSSQSDLSVFAKRIRDYMLKATREAKVHTSWIDANPQYEAAVTAFVEGVLANSNFMGPFRNFTKRVSFFGALNSLSQTLLKITSPGVPDFYQGTELLDLNLVDPDNRRPVDFSQRQGLLQKMKAQLSQTDRAQFVADLMKANDPAAIKLFLIFCGLNFRRQNQELFQDGKYVPLQASGEKSKHVCAFAQQHNTDEVIVVVPRLMVELTTEGRLPTGPEIWNETSMEVSHANGSEKYKDVFTGKIISSLRTTDGAVLRLSDVLNKFPVALLHKMK